MHSQSPQAIAATSPATSAGSTAVRFARPRELAGWTWAFSLDGAKVYVTINHDGYRVLELFVSNGPLSPSVGLLASKMLQRDTDPLEIARLLDKVIGTHSIVVGGRICTSAEQVLAEYIREADRRLRDSGDPSPEARPS